MIDLEQMNLDREIRDQTQAEEEPYVGELVEVIKHTDGGFYKIIK